MKYISHTLNTLITCIVTVLLCSVLFGESFRDQEARHKQEKSDTAKYWNDKYLRCNGEIKRDVEFLEKLGQ